MKKLLIGIPLFCFMLTSCGSGAECDTSTAEGTADCYCKFMEEYKTAMDAEDEEALKEIDEKMDKFEKEAEEHMDAGDYTEDEVEELIGKNCG